MSAAARWTVAVDGSTVVDRTVVVVLWLVARRRGAVRGAV
jgi:hypothetical protein